MSRGIPLGPDQDFFQNLINATRQTWPKPKLLIISYPHNPTTETVTLEFFEKIVAYAKEHNIMVIHDFAYADLVFDALCRAHFLTGKGGYGRGCRIFSPFQKAITWRDGGSVFGVGNPEIVAALRRIKSYLDYGIFQPIQIASIIALNGPYEPVMEICQTYKERRDALISGLNRAGWPVESPKGTMFVWAKIPERYVHMGSVEFAKMLD